MKILGHVGVWFRGIREARLERKAVRRRLELEIMSQRAIQVMEFDGAVYLCHDGMPLLPAGKLSVGFEEALESARATYRKYVESVRE